MSRSKQKKPASQPVLREDIFEAKYRFLIARMQFARNEISFEELQRYADSLIALIKKRRDERFGKSRRFRLHLSTSELIANPF